MAKRQKAAGMGARPGSVASKVRSYIDARPVVREALAMGIVNLTALTRKIQDETGERAEEAILVACRRYEYQAVPSGYEEEIRRILGRSKLEVRNRVGILTTRPLWTIMEKLEKAMAQVRSRNHPIHVIQGSESLTIITDENILDEIERILGKDAVIKKRSGLVELNLRSPEVIEDVPGILTFLTSSLSSRGINFVDVISCHKDNMFLIDEAHMFEAFEVLNGLGRT